MTTIPVRPAAESLRETRVEVHLPGDPGYDAARTPWNLAVALRPAAVALPRSVSEVVAIVRAAAAAGLRVAPMSTGHGAGPLTDVPLDDVVLVRLQHLTGVSVDPAARTARIVGGTLWHDVIAATAPHGLTAAHGSAGDVSAAGYLLGGGLSFYGRRHGVAANLVRAVELVTGDGTLVRADADHHPELFWAVRGGGGNFGVVVAIETELLPYADVYAGMLLWDRERAPEVVRAWASWTASAPESVTTSLRVMSFPPLPELPPFLSGRDLVIIDGAVLEDDEHAATVLAPLRELTPELDTFGRIPAEGLLAVHMDPPAPTPAVSTHEMLSGLDAAAVEEFLRQVGPGTRTGLMFAELRHLGGAFARSADDGGVMSRVEGNFALHTVAVAPTPEAFAAGRAAGERLVESMAAWSASTRVPTFTDDRGRPLFSPEDTAELVRVRRAVDPAGTFLANHQL